MNVIKELRLENNLSQSQLAQAIGTNEKTIIRWENGQSEPSAYYLVKLATFFHVRCDFLLGLEDELGQKSYVEAPSTITPEEQKIITAYRRLSASNRKLILHMLKID